MFECACIKWNRGY